VLHLKDVKTPNTEIASDMTEPISYDRFFTYFYNESRNDYETENSDIFNIIVNPFCWNFE
jgi:hypothetical protein